MLTMSAQREEAVVPCAKSATSSLKHKQTRRHAASLFTRMNRLSTHFPLIIAACWRLPRSGWNRLYATNIVAGKETTATIRISSSIKFRSKRFDVEGKRVSQMTASLLQHYPDDDTADLTDPVITLLRDARPTIFSSRTAHANNDTKVVIMQGDVRGERAAGADQPAQTMATEELTVLTDDEIARTDKPVALTRGKPD